MGTQEFPSTLFETFVKGNSNAAKCMQTVFEMIENIVRKEENAGNQHFLLFSQCFLSFVHKRREKKSLFGKRMKANKIVRPLRLPWRSIDDIDRLKINLLYRPVLF